MKDGSKVKKGSLIAIIEGNAKSILAHLGDDIQDCLKKKATEK